MGTKRSVMEEFDCAVLDAIERQVLVPDVIAKKLEEWVQAIKRELAKNPKRSSSLTPRRRSSAGSLSASCNS